MNSGFGGSCATGGVWCFIAKDAVFTVGRSFSIILFLPWSETVDTGIFRVPLTQGYGGRRQEGVGNGSQGKRSFVHIHSKVTATTLVIYVHHRKTDQIYYGRREIPKSLHRENGPM